MASAASPREVFHALVEGVAAGRLDELPRLYAEQTHVVHPFDPVRAPPLRTRAELAAHFGAGRASGEVLERRVANVVVHETTDPEVVVGEFEYRCTSRATGEFAIPCVFVLRVRDGEIVESRDYIDPLARARGQGTVGRLLDEVRIQAARDAYVRGAFFGEHERAAAALEDLRGQTTPWAELERGKLLHVAAIRDRELQPGEREAFGAALRGFLRNGDAAGEAEARFWLGLCEQFDGDDGAAEPLLRESYELAARLGDRLTQSYAARHLGVAAAARGGHDEARALLRESLRLRQELAFEPGVAAALLALAELERVQGRLDEADALLADADRLARRIGAANVSAWIDEARAAR
jgi:uncharacterized protein